MAQLIVFEKDKTGKIIATPAKGSTIMLTKALTNYLKRTNNGRISSTVH